MVCFNPLSTPTNSLVRGAKKSFNCAACCWVQAAPLNIAGKRPAEDLPKRSNTRRDYLAERQAEHTPVDHALMVSIAGIAAGLRNTG
ncbi:hypothetical protein BES33_19160 [Acinetobacter baumannii]|nr:hypothetical protein BES33_19160 [Acinetobacter baumannii]